MTLNKNRKGDIGPWTKVIIALVLLMIFALLAVSFSAGGVQKTTESLSARVLSKIDVSAIPIPLGKLIPESVKARYFNATITIIPNPPFCQDENITLSAYNSKLPANATWGDIDCMWDIDTSKDANCSDNTVAGCDDKVADDDADLTGCYVETDKLTNAIGQKEIKLKLMIARGEISLGETRENTAIITNVTPLCACDLRSSCLTKPGLTGKIVHDEDDTNITLPSRIENKDIMVTGVHIKTNFEAPADLTLVGDRKGREYYASAFYDVAYIPEGPYTIDGNEKTRSGYTLTEGINNALEECRSYGEDSCTITLMWWTFLPGSNKEPIVEILDVNIPYEIKIF